MACSLRQKQSGFSLIEVMISLTMFAIFATAYLVSQGYNVSDSMLSEEQLILQQLAEKKINELYFLPPKFSNVTANTKETKTFEEKEFTHYEYTLEIKKIVLPDFNQLLGKTGAKAEGMDTEAAEMEDNSYFDEGNKTNRNSNLEKMVFDQLKKNLEKILWQVRVTVRNKETDYSYSLSSWITNHQEKVVLDVGF